MTGVAFWLRLRPLPLTIGAMALLTVLKVAALMHIPGAPSALNGAMVPAARAASPEPTKPPSEPAKPAASASPPASASAPPSPLPGPPQAPPEAGPSPTERAILLELRARRTALEARAETLDGREALLGAAERRLKERLDQLATLQTKLEALDSARRERDEANWRSMVKTYETMRPRDAAAIFNDLEQAVLIQVLDRMKEAKAAPVLAAMQTERARLATTELAKWRTRSTGDTP